jgi:thiamine pyrophosphate-dependent acetolactate synthase large subunit-like protein
LAATLNELQSEDQRPYIYLPEVGNSYFTSYSLKVRGSELGRSWLTNPWYGAMGTSMPYARVVAQQVKKRALDERTVVITGDGGFHFQLNELIHFLKDQTAVTIIYMRNNVFHLGKSADTPIYHCNDKLFDVHSLVAAYQGQSKMCRTVAEFKQCFSDYINENKGVKLIEVPAVPEESRQCNEIRLLNLYIKATNGMPEAVEQWNKVKQG